MNAEPGAPGGVRPGGWIPSNGGVEDSPLCVDLDGPAGESWRQCADVLRGGRPRPAGEAARVARQALVRYPGCLLTVVRRTDGGCTAASWLDGRPDVRVYAPGGRSVTRIAALLYADLIGAAASRPGPAAAPDRGHRTVPGGRVTGPRPPTGPPAAGHRPR
ncbi:hypothetical protein [Streptomyces sp. BE147]|uniref:hypothetical protein n=1 Tax=unclassified Streptomyces TaxID=2593676 RepID=UPI002E77F1CD|nr:hypothetical protein [Streptomyces sp. BE147]MEE1735276.1 hypothetical protein [Streptomyces sp. BE147]